MKRMVVGMSGGVDSSLSAALLKEQGYEVLGVYMQNWSDEKHVHGCASWPKDRQDALAVATRLEIPFLVVNFEKEYKENVIEYFYREYAVGRTPNPDVVCNREIKFGMLLDWARAKGYDGVATGHYARVEHSVHTDQGQSLVGGKTSRLFRGKDRTKDQSYFLSQLSKEQLRHAVFPLGSIKKSEVRAEAASRGLPVADKPDSQGLCFVGEINLSDFLGERIPSKPGAVLNQSGETVGTHAGAAYYTVGQRRGVGVSGPVPLYVLNTDIAANTVTVGYDCQLYSSTLQTGPFHAVSGEQPEDGRYLVSIRYRMEPEPASVEFSHEGAIISFDDEQRGVTPGQFAAVYKGEELLGSAIIN